jgi:nucleotide-binding universal stress UspA family protein
VAEDDAVQRIVVGVDGSETSKAALRWAAVLARAMGAELEAVRAFRYPPALHDWSALPSNYGFLPELPPEDVVERGVHDDLADLVAAELGSDSGAAVRVRRGHPAKVVLEAAADAVALVVGRSGHGGLTELLRVGSVARACAEHASCPVVVVPATANGSAST